MPRPLPGRAVGGAHCGRLQRRNTFESLGRQGRTRMAWQASYKLMLLGVLMSALTVRAAVAFWWQHRLGDPQAVSMPDTYGYWYLGQQIADGQPYQFGSSDARIFRCPGYPILLAGLFRAVGPQAPKIWGRLLGALLGAVAVGGVICLTHAILQASGPFVHDPVRVRLSGLIAGLLAAVYPGAIAASVLLLAEALFVPLMLLHLICWVKATTAEMSRSRILWAAAGGAMAALATLTAPELAVVYTICSGIGAVAEHSSPAALIGGDLYGAGNLHHHDSVVGTKLSSGRSIRSNDVAGRSESIRRTESAGNWCE